MDEVEYIENLRVIRDKIKSVNNNSKFIFIAPWTSTDGDRVSRLSYKDKIEMNEDYSNALKDWVDGNGDIYVDANRYIEDHLEVYPDSKYMIDCIHPNYLNGVRLYSEAFIYNK